MGLPNDLLRADTALALVVAFTLNFVMFDDAPKSLAFAVSFVAVFLVLKHMLLG